MKVVGVDLGIKKIALSYVQDGKLTGTEAYESHSLVRTTQLMDIGDYVYSEVKYYRPAYVFIEGVIIGNNRKYSIRLAETMGAVLANLGLLQTEEDLDVVPVNNKAWKLKTIGNGNATKIRGAGLHRWDSWGLLWPLWRRPGPLRRCGHRPLRMDHPARSIRLPRGKPLTCS